MFKTFFFLFSAIFLLSGCVDGHRVEEQTVSSTNNQVFELEKGIYVKPFKLHIGTTDIGAELYQTIYVFCDENGSVKNVQQKGLSWNTPGKFSEAITTLQ